MQNLALPSFFVTITTGDDQGPSDFFIIPSFSILSTSSLIIVLLFLSALNCFCAIGSCSPVLILCFTTLVFPSFVLLIAHISLYFSISLLISYSCSSSTFPILKFCTNSSFSVNLIFSFSFLFLPYFCCITIFVWKIFFCFYFYIPQYFYITS